VTMLVTASTPLATWLLLHQTYNLIYKHVERCATKAGLSAATALPLFVVKDAGHPLPLSHLAHQLVQEPQSVTSLIDRLEGKGLVRRVPDSRDRRVINVGLTPKGEAVIDTLAASLQEALGESFAPLSPRDADAFSKRLGTLRAHGLGVLGLSRALFDGKSAE
jgi:DNA-binding MarR family transcriptional regulator